jgi:hypothetical protein
MCDVGTDEGQSLCGATAAKSRTLGPEAVAGVNRIAPRPLRRFDDGVIVEVGGYAGTGEGNGFVGHPGVKAVAVVGGEHHDAAQAEIDGGAADPNGDLPPIGDEQATDLHFDLLTYR